MDIKEFVDLKLLQHIQDLFSDATGLAAIAVDAEGNYITRGSNFTDFCMKYTRGSKEGAARCKKCDTECKGTYFCHAGLMDFASDIMINGEYAGAIIGGQVLPVEPDIEKFREIAQELDIKEEDYIKALKKVPIRSEKMIRASADMLGEIISQLVNLEYIKKLNAKKIQVYDVEIQKAASSVLKVKAMMRDLQKIASKENMLALNASVEAARAGTAGAGFSVVAKEIGVLSKNSSTVYSEIMEHTDTIEKSVSKMNQVIL